MGIVTADDTSDEGLVRLGPDPVLAADLEEHAVLLRSDSQQVAG